MRLLHYSDGGTVRVGVRRGGRIEDLATTLGADGASLPQSIDGILAAGLLPSIAAKLAAAPAGKALDAAKLKILSPLLRPGKLIGVGVNYVDHAAESSVAAPTEPVFFAKFSNTLNGPFDPIKLGHASDQIDYEGELAVVIGKRCKDVTEADAMSYVAGYTVANDVSARDWQLKKPLRQWVVGKSFDTFCPLGPDLVTRDEVADPHALRLTTTVSGEVLQDSLTNLHFKIATLVAYFSQVITLEPGDVFLTGTPSGVGQSRTPPRFLREGDVVVTAIEGIGEMRNPVTR